MTVGKTKSVCPVCLKVVDAEKRLVSDGIYMDKECPQHGHFSVLIWEGDLTAYELWETENNVEEPPVNGRPAEKGCPNDCGLCEEHLRKGCCMLLELTKRCNLNCPVCFASAGDAADATSDLPLEEIGRQFDFLMAHGGPFDIQLSGGEPTMRDDLPQIIRLGREKGFRFFQLNTNGIRLAEEDGYAQKLSYAGLNTVFLQFDGLTDDVYRTLRGRDLLDIKLRAIENAASAGLGVVLVPVVAPGVNDGQVGDLLRFAVDNMPKVRGVHFQPISYFGRCSQERPEKPITIPRMLRLMEEQTGGLFPAWAFGGGSAENPYCSFHASFMRKKDGSFQALPRKSGCCSCATSEDSMNFVARQWSGARNNSEDDAEPGAAAASDSKIVAALTDCSCGCGISHEPDAWEELSETSSLDAFLEEARRNTFAVSGMLFQDAMTLDLERLKRCYICEVDSRYGMVPFCAYNLTSLDGKTLYR